MKKGLKSFISLFIIILITFNLIPLNIVKVYAETKNLTQGTTYYWGDTISFSGTIHYYFEDANWAKRTVKAGAFGDEYYLEEDYVTYDSVRGYWSIETDPENPLDGFYVYLGHNNSSPDKKPIGIKYVSGNANDVMDPIVFELVYEEEATYDLWVGNTQVTSENANNILGNDGEPSVTYNARTKTLTLNNATIIGGVEEGQGWGIKYTGDGDLNIIANGRNIVAVNGISLTGSAGIRLGGDIGDWSAYGEQKHNLNITINEGSSLSVYGGDAEGGYYPQSYGICLWSDHGDVTINGSGDFTTSTGVAVYCYGISTLGNVYLNSTGNVNIGTADHIYYAEGLSAFNVTINSGIVNVIPGDSEEGSVAINTSVAIYYSSEDGDVIINDGTVYAKGGEISTGSTSYGGANSYGIQCGKDLIINGGEVTALTTAQTGDNFMAINKAPILASGTYAVASEKSDGTDVEIYNEENNDSYMYFKTPATVCIVTFETDGGTPVPGTQVIASGSLVTKPEIDPQKSEDLIFDGWYTDTTFNTPFDFSKPITSDKTIYAKWKEKGAYLKGDLDKNGVVDANDASVALELYKAQNATAEDIAIGDMDENNLIDANDASLILEYYKTHQ